MITRVFVYACAAWTGMLLVSFLFGMLRSLFKDLKNNTNV